MSQSAQVGIALPIVANFLNELLAEAAGQEIAWVLVCQADGVAQYTSNTERAEGVALIESLLARWKAGRADIPAHYNPDLPKVPSGRSWWEVLGVSRTCTREEVKQAYRALSRRCAPDRPGGSHSLMAELNAAQEAGLQERFT